MEMLVSYKFVADSFKEEGTKSARNSLYNYITMYPYSRSSL